MDTFPLAIGAGLSLRASLADDDGQPIGYDDPPPALAAEVWPGGSRADSFAVAASWVDAAAGEVALTIGATQTLGLDPGRYRGRLVVHDPDLGPGVAYEWLVDLQAAPGDEPEPPSYCAFADLLSYGRSWLRTLQTEDVEAGFAVERGRARAKLDDLIVSRAGSAAGWNAPGTPGYRPFAGLLGGANGGNPYLRSLLDADLLVRRPWVAEATARWALSLICEGQIGPSDGADQFRKLGSRYAAEATALALSSTAEIAHPAAGTIIGGATYSSSAPTINGQAYPMMTIRLGAGSLR